MGEFAGKIPISLDLLYSLPRYRRGQEAEDRAGKALQFLKSLSLIVGYNATQKGSKNDNEGKDYFVKMLSGKYIPLQVKSSIEGQRKHFEKHGYGIPCIVVNEHVVNLKGVVLLVMDALGIPRSKVKKNQWKKLKNFS